MLSAEKAYERRWYTLAVLCLALVVIVIDNSILNIALPTIVRELGASGSDLEWIIDAYIIVFASLLLIAGALGDKYGRRRALCSGLVMFGAFSGLASLATSPGMLIAARALMGVGAAFIFPTTLSILTNTFEGRERAKAIGVWAGVSGVGVAVGPLLGGFLVERFDWGAVFFVNVPVCVAALILAFFFVPDSRDPDNRPLDPLGALLSILTLVALLYAIIRVGDTSAITTDIVVSFLAGLLFLGVFAWWETHTAEPMIDVRVFKNARFSAASAVLTLTSFALYGSLYLLTQYFQFVLGYSPVEAGLLAMPVAIGMMAMSPNAPRLVFRFGTKWVVVIGSLAIAGSMALYASNAIMSSFVGGCLVRLLFGIGLGLTSAPATESIMGSLPPSRAGVGSAINDTTRQTGGAVGIAVIGTLFLTTYHHYADKTKGLSASSAAALHDSIGKALDLARTLPVAQAQRLADLSREAFIQAMRITYPIAAAFIVFAAFVAWKWLPARGADDDVAAHPTDEVLEISEYEILGM